MVMYLLKLQTLRVLNKKLLGNLKMSDKGVWLPSQKNIEDYDLLLGMLNSQKKEFDLLSKKKQIRH